MVHTLEQHKQMLLGMGLSEEGFKQLEGHISMGLAVESAREAGVKPQNWQARDSVKQEAQDIGAQKSNSREIR